MKKVIFLYVCCLLAITSCKKQAPNTFVFKGKIGDWDAPAKLYFSYYDEATEHTDSTILINGTFIFKGTISEPSPSRIFLDYSGEGMARAAQAGNVLYLYLEEGKIEMKSPDSLQNSKFIKSPVNDEFNRYLDAIGGQIQDIASRMNQKMWAATPEQQKDPAFKADLDKEFRALLEERQEKQKQFVRDNPNSFFSLVAISEATPPKFDVEEIEPLFLFINEDLRNTNTGQAFAVRIEAAKNIGIGKKAPDFTQNDPEGNPVSLSDFRGKYLLLDFWASWCGPCRQENPNLVKMYAAYNKKGFEILGVSLDNNNGREAWINAIKIDQLTWTQVSDLNYWNNAVARSYGIRAVPSNFLLDPEGMIIAQDLRGEELVEFLGQLFNKK